MSGGPLRAGEVVRLTRAASPQFIRPLAVRVIRELTDRHTYAGWLWFEGYQLNRRGEAVCRRELYALRAGVHRVDDAPGNVPPRRRSPRRPLAAWTGAR